MQLRIFPSRAGRDEVSLTFDGAGVKWPVELAKPEPKASALFAAARDRVASACRYCTDAFGVRENVQACGITLLSEYEGHPSFRKLISNGYQVITF